MERDRDSITANNVFVISTHTLTWSVTYNIKLKGVYKNISTHTLTWSVTSVKYVYNFLDLYFNSHAHVERDTRFTALALYYTNFNSHAHVERDFNMKRERLNTADFNSHAHVERDLSECLNAGEEVISTHTLTWSVTYNYGEMEHISKFQLTRSRGA